MRRRSFLAGGVSSDNVAAAAAALGEHPGVARPLLIQTDRAGAPRLLDRALVLARQ